VVLGEGKGVWIDDRQGEEGHEPPMQAANPAAAIEHATIVNWAGMSYERNLVVKNGPPTSAWHPFQ
jgi:hypothetical protein